MLVRHASQGTRFSQVGWIAIFGVLLNGKVSNSTCFASAMGFHLIVLFTSDKFITGEAIPLAVTLMDTSPVWLPKTAVVRECLGLIKEKKQFKKIEFKVSDQNAWEVGLACGGEIAIFLEQIN